MTETNTNFNNTGNGHTHNAHALDAKVLRSDADKALAFLKALRRDGPWVLTAIFPDGKTTTKTFEASDENGVRQFIETENVTKNIYFTGNLCGRVSKKPSKADILGAIFLHIDDDPKDGETPEAAKKRILAVLDAYDKPPSIGIDSGNGIQGLWLLDAEYRFSENEDVEERVAEIELRTKALVASLGATPGTHNVDRLLRLPGTINHPNAAKLKKGRVACMASVVRMTDARYPLDVFEKETETHSSNSNGADPDPPQDTTVELTRSMQTKLDLPNLGDGVSHSGYPNRHALLLALLTEMIRARIGTAAIKAACLDTRRRGKAIYEHCQEDGGRDYVARQIKRAAKKIREATQTEMLTDLGNARRLVRLHGKDLRYVAPWRSWLAWDDERWQRDDDGGVMRMAKATIEEMFTEASQMADESRRSAIRGFALKSQNAQRLQAMVTLAKSEEEVVLKVEQVDADPMILGLQNGLIDLRTATFREMKRDDYVTKIAGIAYDATATCPHWLKFLERIFPAGGDGVRQKELIAYVQRMVGYVLTGLTVEEILFVLWGSGNNGKSTFRETLFTLMGDYAGGSDASLLMTSKQLGGATPDVARLFGRRLVTINETPQHSRLNEARVKFITSHDIITARNLFQEPFDFTPTHKTFLTTNHKPIVRDTDEGIWRRLHLVPFITTFPKEERDRSFREKKLLPELPGILNWALEGLRAYLKDGLDPPQEVMDATKEYREDMDIVGSMRHYRAHKKAGTTLVKWWADLDLLAEILTRCGIAVPAPDPETGNYDAEGIAAGLDELLKQHVKGLIEIRRV